MSLHHVDAYGKCWFFIDHTLILSGQIIIFHQPRFPWNKGISLTKPPFGGNRSCEVAIIWPDSMRWDMFQFLSFPDNLLRAGVETTGLSLSRSISAGGKSEVGPDHLATHPARVTQRTCLENLFQKKSGWTLQTQEYQSQTNRWILLRCSISS